MLNRYHESDNSDTRSQNAFKIPTVASIQQNPTTKYKKSKVTPEVDSDFLGNMYVWSWNCRPMRFTGPAKYASDNISTIPTGSLYVASRKGPLSKINAKITGCPYDMIGIVFQSCTSGKEGTYIYTVDTTVVDTTTNNKIVVIKLTDLIKDDSIIHHGVLPLKDFDEEHFGFSRDGRMWKIRMREERNEIIKTLFKKYRDLTPKYDAYQTLASIACLPVAETLRNKNAFTPAELIGLILFQAGLIWDDRFCSANRNPVCGYDKCFFQRLATDDKPINKEYETEVTLITPGIYQNGFNQDQDDISDSSEDDAVEKVSKPIEPIKREIYANTIHFGSLRPVDFLNDYYEAIGVELSTSRVFSSSSHTDKFTDKLVCTIESLADRTENFNVNRVNMSWYHDHLIPIHLDNNRGELCEKRIQIECWALQDLIERLDQDFIQTQMLHADNTSLNEARLLRICRQTSEMAAELHALARECDSQVVSKQTDAQAHVEEFDDDGNDQSCNFITLVERTHKRNHTDNKYLVILHRYMWGADWSYDWSEPLKANSEKYYELVSRLKHLLNEIVDTRNRTPVNCILIEVIVCLQEQTQNLYQYVMSCQKYCFSHERHAPRHRKYESSSSDSSWMVTDAY